MESLVPVLEGSEFFKGLPPRHLHTIAGCATPVRYDAGEMLGHSGDQADAFWLLQSGRVALGFFPPGRAEVTVATLAEGEVAGFSWLLAPHVTRFDIAAVTAVTALRFDGKALRDLCDADTDFGLEIMRRFASLVAARVDAMNLQLLDVYGHHPIEHE